MVVKRLLIIIPFLVVVFLLQSYFWVPTYEEQSKGNPQRLNEYITASLGDASLLNPVLSSDTASSTIELKVFEGLIDRDKDLSFRPRLAKSWNIYEQAFFYVNKDAPIPGKGQLEGKDLLGFLRRACRNKSRYSPELKRTLQNIEQISYIAPRQKTLQAKIPGTKREAALKIKSPARIKILLSNIDQDLFQNLTQILGKDYFSSFSHASYIKPEEELDSSVLDQLAQDLLPAYEHNPVIIFHLRSGVRFHDGHLLDAGDVRFTYEAIMNEKNISPRHADFEPVKNVQVLDKLTVKVVYKKLHSPALSTWAIGILPEHLLNKEALVQEAKNRGRDPRNFNLRSSRFNRSPVGCGPFRFVKWKSDQYIILERFNDYWEGPANYKKYIFRIIPDLLTQEMEFYAGTLDSYSVQPHQVQRLKKDDRFQSFSGTSFGYTYIGYNMRRKPFDDLRVRRALSLAVDVESMIKYVLYGQGERITGPFVKQTDYYNHEIEPVAYDPEAALQMLRQAGWKKNQKGVLEKNGNPLQFTLITNTGNEIRKSVLAIVQDSWKRIGVDVRTDTLEWSVFIQERVNKLDFDAVVLGWQMGIEPDLYQIWHSSQSDPYELNFIGFQNKKADQLIMQIRQEYDHRQQVDYCHRLHEIIAENQPYTFLFVEKWTAVLDKRIVIKERDEQGKVVYKKIKPTKTGDYTFYFNKWVKLPRAPKFAVED